MSFLMSDNEPLALPSMLPSLMSSGMSPSMDCENVLDMVTQDMMLGSEYESTLRGSSMDVTYPSQYMTTSAAPFTSAGDVFLPSISATIASNTFVKPLHTFVQYTPESRDDNTIVKPNPRPARSRLTGHSDHLFAPNHDQMVKDPFAPINPARSRSATAKSSTTKSSTAKSSTTKSSTTKSSTKKSSTPKTSTPKSSTAKSSTEKSSTAKSSTAKSSTSKRSTSKSSTTKSSTTKSSTTKSSTKKSSSNPKDLSGDKKPSRSSSKRKSRSSSARTSAAGTSAARSKGQSLLLTNVSRQSAFVPTSNRNTTITGTTHTITQPVDMVTESTVAFGAEALKYSKLPPPYTRRRTLITETITSYTASNTQSPGNARIPSTNLPDSVPFKFAGLKPGSTVQRTIISPMETAYSIPSSMLFSTPKIIPRIPPTTTAVGRTAEKDNEKLTVNPTQSINAIPAGTTSYTTPTTSADEMPRPRVRVMLPYATSTGMSIVTTTATSTKGHVTYAFRSTQSVHGTSTTSGASTTAPRTLTQSTFSLQPTATLYATRKVPSGRITRSQTTPVTNESQTYAISDGKGSFTTLTISPDVTDSRSVHQAQSASAITQGVGPHTSALNSIQRPRNQMLIPIPNSQMNTSTSLGYLVTSPMGSNITAHSSSAVASTRSATTSSHTITTISSEALNRIRSRLMIPVPHNVPSTTAGLSSLPVTSDSTNPFRTRGPVTIIANQLISARTPSVPSGGSMVEAAAEMVRSLQNQYGLTGPVPSYSSTTATESLSRPVSRMVFPVISNVHTTCNCQSLTMTAGVTSSITNRTIPAAPTPAACTIATSMGSSTSSDRNTTTLSARMLMPMMQNTATTTTIATTSTLPFLGAAGGSSYPATISNTDPHPRLRSRLMVARTTDSSMPSSTTPITAFAMNTRSRTAQSLYAIPAGPATYMTTKPSETVTLLTIAATTAASPAMTSPRNLLMQSSAQSSSPLSTTCSANTLMPTLENTGKNVIIKLSTTPTGITSASLVTTAVTTPITTAVLCPTGHQYLEPRQASHLRTFPAPRTYSVAQRSAAAQVVQRPAAGQVVQRPAAGQLVQRPATIKVSPRTSTKRCLTSPAPLQIFTEVVCPPTNTQSQSTAATPGHSNRRVTHSYSSGNPTSVVPQYKYTAPTHSSTITPPNPERASSRYSTPRSSSDSVVLNRPVAFFTPRRTAIGTQSVGHGAQIASSTTHIPTLRPIRYPYYDTRSNVDRISAASALSPPSLDALDDKKDKKH